MDEEASRLDIQLLTDVFADLDQVLAALPAGAGLRFVPMFDTRQVLRKGLASGALPLGSVLRFQCLGLPLGLGFEGRQVGIPGFLKQFPLLRREGLVLVAKANAPVVCKLQCQGLDLEVRRLEGGRVLSGLVEQFLNRAGDPIGEFWSRVQSGQFSV